MNPLLALKYPVVVNKGTVHTGVTTRTGCVFIARASLPDEFLA